MSDEFNIDLANSTVDPETGEIIPNDKPSTPKPQGVRFSVSLIESYLDNPAHCYARITKQPERKSLALVNGIAVHEAIEDYIKNRNDIFKSYRSTFDLECDKNKISKTGDAYDDKIAEGVI